MRLGTTKDFLSSLPVVKGDLNNSSPLNDTKQDHNDSQHKKQVNKPTKSVGGHQSQQPQHHEDDGNCIEHGASLTLGVHINSHVVNHFLDTVDIRNELGNQVFLGAIFSSAVKCHHPFF